jgi:hypothetical protein
LQLFLKFSYYFLEVLLLFPENSILRKKNYTVQQILGGVHANGELLRRIETFMPIMGAGPTLNPKAGVTGL